MEPTTMPGHHLIMGELKDLLTGEILADTHDERYRQELARRLLDTCGFHRNDIQPRYPLTICVDEKRAVIRIDFVVFNEGGIQMIIRYAPGSLVSRHRPCLASSRLLTGYQIPVVVVTNGEEADILDGSSGSILSRGLDSIPTRAFIAEYAADRNREPVSKQRAELESRVLFAFEVDGACPCDDTVCRV
jgi:hypothetical protein